MLCNSNISFNVILIICGPLFLVAYTNERPTISLVYCVPEFHHLKMDKLPDVRSLLESLKAVIDVAGPRARHDKESVQQVRKTPPITQLMLQSTNSST